MASAQPLGTCKWQLQTYCYVISVMVTQTGSVYTLDGFGPKRDWEVGRPFRPRNPVTFVAMRDSRIVVFCDGAAKGNPGPGGWGVVIATPAGDVIELGAATAHTTNNKMELTAAIQALTAIGALHGPVAIHTDSTYVIKGIGGWIWGWRKRGWKTAAGTDVLNRELWQTLDGLVNARGPGQVSWHYVRGHSGIPGNERVDTIADGLASGRSIALYRGPLATYAVPIFDLPDDTAVPERRDAGSSGRSTKAAAYSYLSLVDGTATRHATWADCERRVKGRSGARFKKAVSAADEAAILRAWQVEPDSP